MSVGILATKGEIDSRMGEIARGQQKVFKELSILKGYLDSTADTDLVAMGYTEGEVAILKSAAADMTQFSEVFVGKVAVSPAKDFSAFVRLLWGVGAQ